MKYSLTTHSQRFFTRCGSTFTVYVSWLFRISATCGGTIGHVSVKHPREYCKSFLLRKGGKARSWVDRSMLNGRSCICIWCSFKGAKSANFVPRLLSLIVGRPRRHCESCFLNANRISSCKEQKFLKLYKNMGKEPIIKSVRFSILEWYAE